ncbi:MAG: RNA polymerase sigma-70 factor (ECF subfamily) [Phycisphaerales bacterium]|jgi:RNA polymerase sigma-70 factor (ECF subfamily)
MPQRTDQQVVAGIARGEDSALGEFLDAHGGWALAVARRFVRDESLAHDALQDSLIHLVERADGLLVAGSVRPWLYAVIRFRAMEQQRQAARHDKVAGAQGAMASSSSEAERCGGGSHDPGSSADPDGVLRAAVGTLPEILREVLILRVVDGLSVSQTALALGIPDGTVKSRLHAAIASLRQKPGVGGLMGGLGPDSGGSHKI